MSKHKDIPPPSARRLLLRFLRHDLAEEVLGDLDEKFYDTLKHRSRLRAQLTYWHQVFNYMRPFAIRKWEPAATSNYYAMFQHTLLISFRNFKKFKSSFLINITGLSTGLACALLIYLWVTDELGMDRFHENDNRLYQVLKTNPKADGTVVTMGNTPARMAEVMTEDLPEVAYAVSATGHEHKGIVSAGDKHIKATHEFAGKDFFKVFSYRLLYGDREKVLTDKYNVLLSDELALKLFNTTDDVLGKTIELEWRDKFNGTYTVSGIFAAPPDNSSARFDMLFAQSLWIDKNNDHCWCNNNFNTYVVLREDADAQAFNEKIRDYSKAKYKEMEGADSPWEGTLQLQRYSDRYLYGNFENGVQAGGKIEYVRLFSIVGIFILAMACINFMNLSTARASRRIKEVGIKKTVGAQRSALVFQYMGESMLMAFFSMLAAIVMASMLLPFFREITGKNIVLGFDMRFLLSAAGIMLATGLVAGSYPALYLSGFNPARVLKGQLRTLAGEAWVRKGLVVFQFAISIVLIASVIVVYRQIEFIQAKNLGYNKDNIIRFSNEGNLRRSITTFLTEVKKIPGVLNASSMDGDFVGHHSGGGGINWPGKGPGDGIEFSGLYVDYDLTEMLGVEMTEGRTFSRELDADRNKVIFNEMAIAMMGLKDPVGQTVTMWGSERQIIGVVKDFHYESLYENVGPFFFACTEQNGQTLIKIKAGREQETIARIAEFYKAYNQGLPFDYQFLDQDYATLYAAENRVAVLSRYFAGAAILISCLGLFGLTAFTAERRTKEIGIRKVLGSSALGIVYLLSGDFTKMVLASIAIAIPVSYFLAKSWLNGFAYRVDLTWWYFAGAGVAAFLVAWLTVSMQTIKAANINPVQCLKSE